MHMTYLSDLPIYTDVGSIGGVYTLKALPNVSYVKKTLAVLFIVLGIALITKQVLLQLWDEIHSAKMKAINESGDENQGEICPEHDDMSTNRVVDVLDSSHRSQETREKSHEEESDLSTDVCQERDEERSWVSGIPVEHDEGESVSDRAKEINSFSCRKKWFCPSCCRWNDLLMRDLPWLMDHSTRINDIPFVVYATFTGIPLISLPNE